MSQPRQHGQLAGMLGMGTNSPKAAPPVKPWRGVFFEGPEPAQDHEGDEIPVWFVFIGDRDADPVGKVYRCHAFGQAENLAQSMAKDRKLELVREAMPA